MFVKRMPTTLCKLTESYWIKGDVLIAWIWYLLIPCVPAGGLFIPFWCLGASSWQSNNSSKMNSLMFGSCCMGTNIVLPENRRPQSIRYQRVSLSEDFKKPSPRRQRVSNQESDSEVSMDFCCYSRSRVTQNARSSRGFLDRAWENAACIDSDAIASHDEIWRGVFQAFILAIIDVNDKQYQVNAKVYVTFSKYMYLICIMLGRC